MRRRGAIRRRYIGAGIVVVVAVAIGVSVIPNLRREATGGLQPTALNRIARKNDQAAAESAAQLRARSLATISAAESLRAAEHRPLDQADAATNRPNTKEAGLNQAQPAR